MNTTPDPAAPATLQARLSRLDTAALSDALDSLHAGPCVLPGIQARTPGARAAGPVFTVRYRVVPDSTGFRNAANYIDDVPSGSIVLVDNGGNLSCTNWGSLLTHVAQLRGIAGTVVHGSVRDIHESRSAGYPMFSTGVTMVSGKNRVMLDRTDVPLDIHGTTVAPGDWICADDNGALRIPVDLLDEVIERAETVERTESRIREAVGNEVRLDQARIQFGYAEPWRGKA